MPGGYACSGVVAGAILAAALNGTGPVYGLQSAPQVGGKMAHVMACGQGASPIGLVVNLSDARTTSALETSGYRPGVGRAIDPGASATVLLSPTKADGTPVSLAALDSVPGVLSAGPVFPQSSDPTLQSCDYRLQDRPQAQRLVSAAEAALAAAGMASRQQMDGNGSLYL